MRAKWLVLLIALFSIVTLAGCGGSGSGGSDVADGGDTSDPNVAEVGIANCLKCHDLGTPETFTWLMSTHANPNESPGRSGPAGPDSSCAPCHNQRQAGQQLPEIFAAPRNVAVDGDTTADVARNIVVCESCHGNGSAHRGVGPIPYARPDWEQCVSCHDHPEGVRHAEDYGLLASSVGASAHNNSAEGTDGLHASRTRCQRCHTAEGAVALSRFTGDADVMHLMDDIEPLGAEEDLHPVTCATCHKPHNDSGRWEEFVVNNNDLVQGNWDPNNNGVPDQFDFCTQCHLYYNYDGRLVSSGSAASGTAEFYHEGAWYRQITSTHYDDPTTGYDQAVSKIEGYNLRKTSADPCFDCHGHEFRTNTRRSRDVAEADDFAPDYGPTIFTDWASSRHGGNLLLAKYAADPDGDRTQEVVDNVRMAGVEDEVGQGWSWTHYDWDAANRQGCQRCHTATGTSNYMKNPAGYDPANNDFSHLEGWAAGGSPSSGQNEMLYCWGCHENPATGVLNNPGAIVEDYAGEGVVVNYADLQHSNTCMTCHLGREIGQNINNVSDFSSSGFVNSHYLAAGASVFAVSGYAYPGLNYAVTDHYAHDSIGTAFEATTHGEDLAQTDNDMGPCVGCHMTAEEGSHNYLPFELNEDHTAFEYLTPVCAGCHTVGSRYEITPALIMEQEEGYEAALDTLDGALQQVGIFYSPGYPYFFNDSNGNGVLDASEASRSNGVRNWIKAASYPDGRSLQQAGAFTMGAAFNLNLARHDPGGFAHNRYYYKRLIWDAIDWLDDYVFNGSVPNTIANLQAAGKLSSTTAAHASDYLGNSRPGDNRASRAPINGLDATTNF